MMSKKPAVLINIVLYNPDQTKILELIHICSNYKHAVILLFDNTPGPQRINFTHCKKIILYKSTKNVGVGGAHYTACKMAEAENFDFVLFLDQDSQLPSGFLNEMLSEFYHLQTTFPRLCAIGPSWSDPEYKKSPSRTTFRNKLRDLLKVPNLNHILISSGMLIWVPTLKHIGYPKKEYFIDLVDTEWCLRALSKKYEIFRLNKIYMLHRVGEIKKLGKFSVQYEQPIRYYYSIRNSLFLFRERNISLSCKLFILAGNLFKLRKIIFSPSPIQSLMAVGRGIKDGFFLMKRC